MTGIFRGPRPDITPAQVAAAVPVVANLLNAFGVFTLNAQQTDSLQTTVAYGLALVAGDAVVRVGRNIKDARVEAAAVAMPGEPPQAPVEPEHENLMAAGDDLDEDPDVDLLPPLLADDDVLAEDRVAEQLEGEELRDPQAIRPEGERPDGNP